MLFPHDSVEAVVSSDGAWLDRLLEQTADTSDSGAAITPHELDAFDNWQKGESIIESWNRTLEEMWGDNLDLRFPEQYAHLQRFRQLIEKADRLKSLTRWGLGSVMMRLALRVCRW